jgi:phage FluMu protein Com
MLKVSCPRCKKIQSYQPQTGSITDKIKRCVYCGCSFKVHSNQVKSRIIN